MSFPSTSTPPSLDDAPSGDEMTRPPQEATSTAVSNAAGHFINHLNARRRLTATWLAVKARSSTGPAASIRHSFSLTKRSR
jgi:hypothetical protein